MKRWITSPFFHSLLVLLFTPPLFFLAYQTHPSLHFGIGRWDRSWLEDASSFYPPARMEGPLRHEDGSVEVQDFVARLTRRVADFRLPYHARRSPLRIRLRCHRFGLGGTVALSVNGHPIEEFVFSERSYPWGGIRAVIPQEVAEEGPLRIRLETTGGKVPPSHLPDAVGIGVDWIEVEPMSQGVLLLPTRAEWLRLFLLLVSFAVLLRYVGAPRWLDPILLLALVLTIVVFTIVYHLVTSRLLEFAWLFVIATMLLLWLAELADRIFTPLEPAEVD